MSCCSCGQILCTFMMTKVLQIWNMKLKYFIAIIVTLSVLTMVYFAIIPEEVFTLGKADFFKLKKSHTVKTLKTDAVKDIVALSDMNKFKEILNPLLKERVSGTPGNLEVQGYIVDQMKGLGWDVLKDKFTDNTPYGSKEFTNIIATQNTNKRRKLTLACHFDSKLFPFRFIGATDSSVPCAMMIDLARTLKNLLQNSQSSPKARDISLQFIFFDGEEAFKEWTSTDSIYGARHLANKMHTTRVEVDREVTVTQLQTMDVLILLDLIGTPNPTFLNWFPYETGTLFTSLQSIERKLAEQGHLTSSNRYFVGGPQRGGGIQDDHIPFLHRNVRVLHLISYPFPRVWHKQEDDESALHYDTINNLNKILRVFVASYLHLGN